MTQSIRNSLWGSGWFVGSSWLGAGNSKTRKTPLTTNNYLLEHIGITIVYPIYLLREIVALLSRYECVFYYADCIQFPGTHQSPRDEERTSKGIWTETYLPLHSHLSPVTASKCSVDIISNQLSLFQLTTDSQQTTYRNLLKFSISLVGWHLTKLLRHIIIIIIIIITRVPNFHYIFILPQWIHFIYSWPSCPEKYDRYPPVICSQVHAFDLFSLTFISTQRF